MFTELTIEESQQLNGGFLPAIPIAVKVVIGVVGLLVTAGSLKGCADEHKASTK